MKYIITCTTPDGHKVKRICFSEFQAFTVVNTLRSEGCHSFGMHEE